MFSLMIKGFPTATALKDFLVQHGIQTTTPMFKSGSTTYTIEVDDESLTK